MCITEPFQAVSCFGTKHLCSSHAWHLKTYLYNVSAPFVFFILIFSSVFLVSHPDCKEWGFPLRCSRLRHWLPLAFLPFCGQRWNNPKWNTVLPASSSLHWAQHHQRAVGWSAPESLQKDLVLLQFLCRCPACGHHRLWDAHGCNPFC